MSDTVEPELAAEEAATAELHLATWRARALDTLLRIQTAVAVVSMILLTGPAAELSIPVVVFGWILVIPLAAVTLARRLPYGVRAWVYVLGGLVVCNASAVIFGFKIVPAANGLVAVMFAVLLLGPIEGVVSGVLLLASLSMFAGASSAVLENGVMGLARPHQVEVVVTAVALFPLLVQIVAGTTVVLRGVEHAFAESLAVIRAGEQRPANEAAPAEALRAEALPIDALRAEALPMDALPIEARRR